MLASLIIATDHQGNFTKAEKHYTHLNQDCSMVAKTLGLFKKHDWTLRQDLRMRRSQSNF